MGGNPHVCSEVNESRSNWGSDIKTTALSLKGSLQSFGVIVSFTVLKNSLDYLKGLSPKPQRRDTNIFEAYTMIHNIKSEIQCLILLKSYCNSCRTISMQTTFGQ